MPVIAKILLLCVYVYVSMASKTVSLSEEAYARLKKWKKSDGESFSSVILRVLPKSRDISKLLEESDTYLSEEEAEKLKKDIE